MSSVYLRSKIYWYKYSINGKPRYQSLKTRNKRVAAQLQKKLDNKYSGPNYKPESDYSLKFWIEKYLEWHKQSVSKQHYEHCKGKLFAFAEFSDNVKPDAITVEIVQNWIDQLPHGPKTANDYKCAVSKFLKYCRNKGVDVDITAATSVMTPTRKKNPPRFLTSDQECEVIRKAYRYNKVLYLQIIVAIRTGMRMSEIIRMQWEYIDFTANTIFIPKTKNGRPRTIPLHRTLKKRLYRIRKKSGLVFSGTAWSWCWQLRQIKTPIFTEGMNPKATGRGWHLFRHTFASRLVQAGVDIFKVSKWLGHASVTTTMIYAHLSPHNYDEDINRL